MFGTKNGNGRLANIAWHACTTLLKCITIIGFQPFRYGHNIAFIASCLLDTLKNVQAQTLTGGYQPRE